VRRYIIPSPLSATVLRFITHAAQDPDVLAIKMTHTAPRLLIMNALIAARNGKARGCTGWH